MERAIGGSSTVQLRKTQGEVKRKGWAIKNSLMNQKPEGQNLERNRRGKKMRGREMRKRNIFTLRSLGEEHEVPIIKKNQLWKPNLGGGKRISPRCDYF